MHRIALLLVIGATPGALAAQSSGRAQANTKTEAQVKSSSGAQASAATSVDAEIAIARKRGLPTHAIRSRAAEGRAKGATEAEVALSAAYMRAKIEAAHEALVRGGRKSPKSEEVERGAYAMERGYSRAHIEAVAKSAPGDRSLVVALDVLTKLAARGVPVTKAMAQIESKLASRASDAEIRALTSVRTNAVIPPAGAQGSVGASGNTAVGAAANGAGAATGAVGGAVGAVIKKP